MGKNMADITLFKAKKVITMNPRQPTADYIAVKDGLILGAGPKETLTGWGEYEVDERFADKVILPGFIEGHCHSWEGAAWEDTYVGFLDRTAPNREVHSGLKDIDSVVAKLKQAEQDLAEGKPVKGWGLDPIFFERRVTVSDLDRVSTTRPVVVVHQSGHIINVNSFVLEKAGIDRETDVDGLVVDDNGDPTGELMGIALYQTALKAVGVNSVLDMGENAERSLRWFANSAQIAGVTTVTDLASELTPEMLEVQQSLAAQDDYPIRVVPAFMGQMVPSDQGVDKMLALKDQSTPKLRLGLIKLIIDGSIQGFTARMKSPGYYNGADNGLWYVDPNELPSIIAAYHGR